MNPFFSYEAADQTADKLTLSLLVSQQVAAYLWIDSVTQKANKGAFFQLDNWDSETYIDQFLDICVRDVETPQTVQVCFDAPQQSMMPIALYDRIKLDALHKAAFPFNPSTFLVHESFSSWQFYLGYAVPTTLFRKLENRFPAMKYRHTIKLLLNNYAGTDVAGALYIQVGISQLTLVLCRSGRLLFSGSFAYQTEMDALFYLLRLADSHNLPTEDLEVYLSGLIDPSSRLFLELSNYFLNLSAIPSSILFDSDLPSTNYFTLLSNNSLCVS